jgi:hypothetical protein
MEWTKEEKEFLKNLVTQITIRPSQPDAAEVVAIVKTILQKLNEG